MGFKFMENRMSPSHCSKVFIVSLAIAATVSGCATTASSEKNAQTSNVAKATAVGALAGASVGAAVSHNDRASGAGIGAVLGGGAAAALAYRNNHQELELRDKLKGSGVAVDAEDAVIKLTIANGISFDSGNADLRDKVYPKLKVVADSLKAHPNTSIKISGFTDSKGDIAQNRSLSLERAKAIAHYFVSEGIDARRIEVRGAGPGQPIADNDSAMGRAKNRRVEILISALSESSSS